jgi:hypothetical protein
MRQFALRLIVCLALLSLVIAAIAEGTSITVTVSPKVLVLSAPTKWVHIHSDMPLASVDRSTLGVTVNGNTLSSFAVFADSCGFMVIKIGQALVDPHVAPGTATFSVTGVTEGGLTFADSDTIQVKK